MQLELRKNTDGTGFAIFIIGVSVKLMIPLAHDLSQRIEKMLAEENIRPNALLVPPHIKKGFKV